MLLIDNKNESKCKIPECGKKVIQSICSKPNCPNKLCCISCVSKVHRGCGYPNIPIQDVDSAHDKILEGWPINNSLRELLLSNTGSNDDVSENFEKLKKNIHEIIDSDLEKIKNLILDQDFVRSEILNVYDPRKIAVLLDSFQDGQRTQHEVNIELTTIFSGLEASEPTFLQQLTVPKIFSSEKIVALWTNTIEQVSKLVIETIAKPVKQRFGVDNLSFTTSLVRQSPKAELVTQRFGVDNLSFTTVLDRQSPKEEELKIEQNNPGQRQFIQGSNGEAQQNQGQKPLHNLTSCWKSVACQKCGKITRSECKRCNQKICDECGKKLCP